MSDDNGIENGTEGVKRRVRFGQGKAQSVPHEWAEDMLCWLFTHQQRAFQDALASAIGLNVQRPGRKTETVVR